jgi:hypothetical protein
MPQFHRCEIRDRDDGHVLARDVTCALEVGEAGETPPWSATLTITHTTNLVSGATYLLILDDGRAGECRVRRNTFAGDMNRAVAVDGMGALRPTAAS